LIPEPLAFEITQTLALEIAVSMRFSQLAVIAVTKSVKAIMYPYVRDPEMASPAMAEPAIAL
jgi:hypothetical protein